MGKDSLIKSTSKKKTTTSKEEEAKKKTATKAAAKSKKAAKPKKTVKPTAAQKTKSASSTPKTKSAAPKKKTKTVAAKPVVKKKAASAQPKTKDPAAAKKPKKATIPELLAKKFDQLPGAPKPKAAAPPKAVFKESPPIISTSDPQETARIRALLMTKFSMAEIKAAAQPPKAEKPEVSMPDTHAPEPIAQVETPAEKAVETPAAPSDEPPVVMRIPQEDTREPMPRGIKYSIAAAVLLVLLVLGVSHNNSTKYYIQPKEGAIEIWKGRFSPKDRKFFMVLHGVQLDQEVKSLYSQSEVFPIIFDYYLDKADTLLEVPGMPDFEGIKEYLHQAQSYVTTPEMRAKVAGRLNSIERMALLYKADVAISKNTEDSLGTALKHLKKASGLVANPNQRQEIDQKIELVKKLRTELKSAVK